MAIAPTPGVAGFLFRRIKCILPPAVAYLTLNIVLAIVPTVALLLFFYTKDKQKREPPILIFVTFVLGFVAVIPTAVIEVVLELLGATFAAPVLTLVRAFIVAGLAEEGMKLAVVRLFVFPRKDFDEVVDGIVYTIAASLGFAFFETILYSFGPPVVIVIRGLTAVPLHVIASGILGYHIGLARFGKAGAIGRGLVAAVLIHGTYDYLLFMSSAVSFLVVPLLVFGAWHLLRLYRRAIDSDRAAGRS